MRLLLLLLLLAPPGFVQWQGGWWQGAYWPPGWYRPEDHNAGKWLRWDETRNKAYLWVTPPGVS